MAEEREGLGERASSYDDFSASLGDEIECGKVLEYPHGIGGTEHGDGAGEANLFKSSARCVTYGFQRHLEEVETEAHGGATPLLIAVSPCTARFYYGRERGAIRGFAKFGRR